VLDQVPDHIDPKTVDALAEPEPHDLVDRLAHRGVAPVQVGLLGEEGMIIILSGRGIMLPGAAAEFRQPVVWRPAVRTGIAPDVPVALVIVARTAACSEPGMLVGGMVRYEVKDDLETAAMCDAHQRVEVLHGAEERIDAVIVGNVVPEIGHRRWKDR